MIVLENPGTGVFLSFDSPGLVTSGHDQARETHVLLVTKRMCYHECCNGGLRFGPLRSRFHASTIKRT